MADTAINICNRALAAAGARSTITSLAEASNEARNCNLFYQSTLAFVLAKARWNFAQNLIGGEGQPNPVLPQGWTNAFLYPGDCVKLQSITPLPSSSNQVPIFGGGLGFMTRPGGSLPFALGVSNGARVIFCRVAYINIAYTAIIQDLGLWEPQALVALELALAAKLAIPLSGDKTLAQGLMKQFDEVLLAAAVADGLETVQVNDIPTDWLMTRTDCLPETYGYRPGY